VLVPVNGSSCRCARITQKLKTSLLLFVSAIGVVNPLPANACSSSCMRTGQAAGRGSPHLDQRAQVEHLKASLHKLQRKLEEARARSELLIAQHRRARALRKTTAMEAGAGSHSHGAAFRRMQDKVDRSEAVDAAMAALTEDGVDDRLAALEEQEVVERLLGEMKARRREG